MTTPLLGWISPEERTQKQRDAHERAMAKMPKFTLAPPEVPKGTKVVLTDTWKNPDIITRLGVEFSGFHQLTGSCVGASEGDAVVTLSFMQALLTEGATEPFIIWWPFPYGRTRYHEGDRGQGEGAVDSVMGETLGTEGCFDIKQAGLPQFQTDDGWYLTSKIEMQWSDGAAIDQKWIEIAKPHILQSHAPINDSGGIKASILNGYPILDGCNNYVGHGSIKGSGADAYVVGHYDGRGGHSTCFLGYWEHPNDGPLFLYSNQWPTSTYPKDPAGGGRCCVWLPISEVDKLFRTGGGDGETMSLSHLNWFPSQVEKVLSYFY